MRGLRIAIIAVLACLLVSLVGNVWQYTHPRTETVNSVTTVFERDTIIDFVCNTDTIYVNRFTTDTVYRTKVINDTVYIADIPRTYSDETPDYSLSVNAVKMNWYKLDIHARDTVRLRDVETVVTVPTKQSRWGFGLFAGPSYDIYNRQWGVAVGAGLTFRIK